MKKTARKLVSLILCLVMVAAMMPLMTHAETPTAVTTTYEKVHSLDEIVPNARYIIVGTYYDEVAGEVTYHAMGKENTRTYGYRYSYGQDQKGTHHFDISEDTETITLYSYPAANYDPILRVRLLPQGKEGRYYFRVDGQGYLCGYTNSTSDGANGHSAHRCMPISNYTKGERWWHMSVPTEGENAGEWQIVNRAKLGSSVYCYDIMTFTYPYPHSDGQFQAREAYREDAGVMPEDQHIEYMEERSTNIWIYREVCAHADEEVTHMEAVEASCAKAGVKECWYCAGCCQYFSDETMTQNVKLEDCLIAPAPHTYDENGDCTVCGLGKTESTFLEYTDSYYSSNMDGELFIAVGFKDGKAYAMGNNTNPDGSREAVEVTVKANGAITTDSVTTEFFAFEFDNVTFCPDGNYMTTMGGKILVYDKSLLDAEGLPEPIRSGYGYFWRSTQNDGDNQTYIIFDPETLTFRASETGEDSIVLYKEACKHPDGALYHCPETKPTCTEQGSQEYWYCDLCYNYYQNGDLETPVEIYGWVEEVLTAPALGHSFNDQDICDHCGMKRPVYSQISTLAEFDALSKDAYYLIVVKDGDKTYAAALQPENPYWDDWNGDGEFDLFQVDENGNGIPDCIENVDLDENGVLDYLEDQNYNDEVGDLDDYYYIYFDVAYALDEINMMASNFVEVTMAPDGTITLADEGAMEFQLMVSGILGGSPYFEEDFIYHDIKDTERVRAAWVPNYWVGYNGMLGYYDEGHFGTMRRIYGDFEYPGMVDMKNWKISFNGDGTACLVDTWESYDDTGALQFVKYTNYEGESDMTFVGLPEWLWTDSEIMQNATEKLPVYLFACEPENTHTHEYGQWTADDDNTHSRACSCGDAETEAHSYDEGVVAVEPTYTEEGQRVYTCAGCGHTKTESIPKLDPPAGDASGDGVVNAKDVVLLRQYLAGWDVAVYDAASDVNNDGKVNAKDVVLLRQYLAGWDVTLGSEA